eukprot:2897210-Pleurochrysis_carterae.AAC.1
MPLDNPLISLLVDGKRADARRHAQACCGVEAGHQRGEPVAPALADRDDVAADVGRLDAVEAPVW